MSFQALHVRSDFGLSSQSRQLLGKEFARRRKDVANDASQL